MRKSPIALPIPKLWSGAAASTASVKATNATASLNRLSPSTRTDSRLVTPRDLKNAMTATGSVADISAPKATAASHGTPTSAHTIQPTANVPSMVPPMAKIRIGTRSALSLAHGKCRVASKSSGGISSPRMSSGEKSRSTKLGKNAKAKPTSTRATVYGILIRLTMIAIAAATVSSTTTLNSCSRKLFPSSAARSEMPSTQRV